MDRGRGAGPVGDRKPESDRMPESRLDRDHRAAGPQQVGRLGEARRERALVGDVVEHQPVQDHIERRRRQPEPAGVSDLGLVGSAGLA